MHFVGILEIFKVIILDIIKSIDTLGGSKGFKL